MENTLLMSCFAQSGPAALVAFLFSPPPGHKDRPNKELEITRRSNKTRQKEEEGQQQKQEQLLRAGSWELSSKSTSWGARSTQHHAARQLGDCACTCACQGLPLKTEPFQSHLARAIRQLSSQF